MEDQILALVIFAYGFGVSWLQERFGKFEKLEPRQKQLWNSVFAFIVPAVVAWLVPLFTTVFGSWPDALGDPNGLVGAVLRLAVPVLVWLVSQVAHYVDLGLNRAAKGERASK
jgi:hypothetical protein